MYSYAVAAHSLKSINSTGVSNIREHNIMLADKIIRAIDAAALVSPSEPELRSGTLIIHFGARHEKLISRLQEQNVQFDSRVKGIRLSPHLCNSSEQIDALIDCISSF